MNNTNTNTLPQIKSPFVLYPFIAMIIILIIVLFGFLFNVPKLINNTNKSEQEIVANVFIILFFTILVVGICIILLPNFKDIKKLFEQISNVTYIIIYTIFLILFFTLLPSNTLDKYANIITISTIAIGAIMFYKSSTHNYINDNFNFNYERIKNMILFFCLITIFIIYYNIDPGGYIQKYFGYSMLLTIIITIFAFLYLLITLTLSDTVKSSKSGNLLDNFSGISKYGSIGFILFIIAITIAIYTYPGGFFKNKEIAATAIVIILIICILWSVLLGANLFSDTLSNSVANEKMSLFKRSLLFLFGIIISGLIIGWIAYNIQNLSGKSSIVSFVLNLLLIILFMGLIYKTINVQLPAGNSKKNAFFTLITNTIFYIPCLFNGVFDSIGKVAVGEYNAPNMGSVIMLLVSIALLVGYYETPSLLNKINLQGGKQLVNSPVYTDSLYSLGNFQELNGGNNLDYTYAISFWLYLDSAPPNTNASYSKYTSILNFGEKPNVLYNGKTNTLMVTIKQKNLKDLTKNKLIDFDDNDNRILYKNENMLLQKWNNIIINYNGGILDIFLNGELVKSDSSVVPYYTIENLTIGEDNGIKGGICNVVYFRRALTASNIYYLYNMVKGKSPPVVNDSNKTILTEDINTLSSSTNTVVVPVVNSTFNTSKSKFNTVVLPGVNSSLKSI
jgi:hypothetical protein